MFSLRLPPKSVMAGAFSPLDIDDAWIPVLVSYKVELCPCKVVNLKTVLEKCFLRVF